MSQNFFSKAEIRCPLFYRTKTISTADTLFLIGNGSIENGSFPLSEALNTAQNENFFPFQSDKIGEAALSYVSLDEQDMFDLLILHLKGAKPTLPRDEMLSGFQLCVGRLFAYAIGFREILARMYSTHLASLNIRDDIWGLLQQEGIEKSTSVCATTNWDEVLWNHPAVQTVLHIHGRSSCSSSLILPTERVSQRYLKSILMKESSVRLRELAEKENASKCVNQLIDHYASEDPNSVGAQMAAAENLMISWLSSVQKIVISGVRFNDYDHELIATVATFKHKNLREIVLINRAADLSEEKVKVNKVAGLFSCSSSIVRFRNTLKIQKELFLSPSNSNMSETII